MLVYPYSHSNILFFNEVFVSDAPFTGVLKNVRTSAKNSGHGVNFRAFQLLKFQDNAQACMPVYGPLSNVTVRHHAGLFSTNITRAGVLQHRRHHINSPKLLKPASNV